MEKEKIVIDPKTKKASLISYPLVLKELPKAFRKEMKTLAKKNVIQPVTHYLFSLTNYDLRSLSSSISLSLQKKLKKHKIICDKSSELTTLQKNKRWQIKAKAKIYLLLAQKKKLEVYLYEPKKAQVILRLFKKKAVLLWAHTSQGGIPFHRRKNFSLKSYVPKGIGPFPHPKLTLTNALTQFNRVANLLKLQSSELKAKTNFQKMKRKRVRWKMRWVPVGPPLPHKQERDPYHWFLQDKEQDYFWN